MITYVLIGAAVIMLLLLYYIYSAKSRDVKAIADESIDRQTFKGPCILCSTPLRKGERVASQIFKGEKESIVRVLGCPHCYGPGAIKERICPVCGQKMPNGSYLQGRMWLKKSGKQHLHISGCTSCMGTRR